MNTADGEPVLNHMTEDTDIRYPVLVPLIADIIADKYPAGSKILAADIGANAGMMTRMIETAVHERGIPAVFIGIDPQLGDVIGPAGEIPARKSSVPIPLGSRQVSNIGAAGERLPFAPDSLDLLMEIDSAHHSEDPLGFIRDMWRVVKPGGYLIIKDHNPGSVAKLLQSAVSDILGNTADPDEQKRQILSVLKTAMKVKFDSRYFRAPENTSELNLKRSQMEKIQGTHPGDTVLAFSYITQSQWQDLFREFGVRPEEKPVRYRYLPDTVLSGVMRWLDEHVSFRLDQKNCFFILRKPSV